MIRGHSRFFNRMAPVDFIVFLFELCGFWWCYGEAFFAHWMIYPHKWGYFYYQKH